MSEALRKVPSHEVTYTRLRDMILYGHLTPGQPVTIQGLTADLGAGMTPVREAIRRLATEGALLPQGNRRVSVPRLTASDLDQIAFARLAIEPRLALLAADHASQLLLAKLEELDAEVDRTVAAGDVSGYLASNHAFHFALYGVAGAGVLLDMAQSLWLRFGPSLRVVTQLSGRASLPESHKDILTALRRGDGAGAAGAMTRDIELGLGHVREAISANTL
ncbi:MAG: GntR family transcriptional regulator [Cypionkella sp.]|nr:GntR family transcriptional regulator [Cypionkella sp.]